MGKKIAVMIVMVGFFWTCLPPGAEASESCKPWIAKVVSFQGVVETRKQDRGQWVPVNLNDVFCTGDMIRTRGRSRAAVLLCDDSVIRMDQSTAVTIFSTPKPQPLLIDLIQGAMHFFNRMSRGLEISTPFVNGFVEGTEFFVRVEADRTHISIFNGTVSAVNKQGRLVLSKGQSAIARSKSPPVLQAVARPQDAVQWTLYYPRVLNFRADDFSGPKNWQSKVRQSIQAYLKGELSNAFSSLDQVQERVDDPDFFIYQAELFLAVGRAGQARQSIRTAMGLDPGNSGILSLESIIALAQNQKKQALDLANQAVDMDPGSPAARIALSYALQADFDLAASIASLEKAVSLDPENALAWARLGELFLSVGKLEKGALAAHRAVQLNPSLSRTRTVLGFSYLVQIQIKKSMAAFKKAIELDSEDPLPRLGLGLALIRDGLLGQGRREIEIAVGLNPGNALVRSYLGKAYFEENHEDEVADQLEMAKVLDPDDPTPWYYDAFFQQAGNRPVQALKALDKSIELNDNRAVYRSRLLLDQDLGARSASRSRIYQDLDFSQLALAQGYDSLNNDPFNYSAHRFLADSYSILPRHDIARASELLQARLMQPVNIRPVQPELAGEARYILRGTGPLSPGFNEFSQLFERNRLALQAGAIGGQNHTWAQEFIASGIRDNLSFSLGQFHYETDGYHSNNDQDQDIFNGFVQVSLSHKTSVQAEFRHTSMEYGDLEQRFYTDSFYRTQRNHEVSDAIRMGFRHSFDPGSQLIGSVLFMDKEYKTDIPEFWYAFSEEEEGGMGELQHLFRSKQMDTIFGIGYYNADRRDMILDSETKIEHKNAYGYAYFSLPHHITWILGASADFLEGAIVDKDKVNPKLGVIWTPRPGTSFRASCFWTLQRTLLSSQTLEPTHVAGFNQFFNDAEGAAARRWGIGIDQKLSRNLYGGVEWSRRDIDVPFEYYPDVETADWEESLARAYLYWPVHSSLSLTLDYLYEKLERTSFLSSNYQFNDVETHQFPMGINYFHPSGFMARFKMTHVHQNGRFTDTITGAAPGKDQFNVFDAGIGFRLPKRRGIISVESKNILNENFNYQDTDPTNPKFIPDRLILIKISLSF